MASGYLTAPSLYALEENPNLAFLIEREFSVEGDLEEALDELDNSKNLREAYGENVINSYLKLKKQELDTFYKVENFDKKKSVTEWEKSNSLDC